MFDLIRLKLSRPTRLTSLNANRDVAMNQIPHNTAKCILDTKYYRNMPKNVLFQGIIVKFKCNHK